MAEFHVEIALLSGRTAYILASPYSSVRQVMLDAGKELRIVIGTLTRQDGSQLEEMSSMLDAQLINGEVLSATAAPVRVELEEMLQEQLVQLEEKMITSNSFTLEVKSPEEMAHLFHLILSKALSTPACASACAELMCSFLDRYPTLDARDDSVTSPTRCKRLLLHVVQATYDKLFPLLEEVEAQKRSWWSGWLQVFGYLLMQRLITIRVAELVFEDMIGIEDGPLPRESYVLCACDLLELCGHFLDNSGADLMRLVFDRLIQLYTFDSCHGKSPRKYSRLTLKRLEGVFRLRGQCWQPKA